MGWFGAVSSRQQAAAWHFVDSRPSARCVASSRLPAPCRARPASTPQLGKEDWFNVFVLHQNRVAHTQVAGSLGLAGMLWQRRTACQRRRPGPWLLPRVASTLLAGRCHSSQNAKNLLREGALARFLDLVVWGHEHECLAEPWESVEGRFHVMQPGSSGARGGAG